MAFGSAAGRGNTFTIQERLLAASVDVHIFFAHTRCKLIGIKEIHSVVGGASAAVRPRKITADATAPGATAGATVLELSASIDLTATANTAQTPAVTETSHANYFDVGDKLALDFSGTLTGLVGVIEFEFLEL